MLEALGITRTSEAVYRLLLEQPHLGTGRMAAHLDLDEDRVRAAPACLADLNLVRFDDAADRFEAFDPGTAASRREVVAGPNGVDAVRQRPEEPACEAREERLSLLTGPHSTLSWAFPGGVSFRPGACCHRPRAAHTGDPPKTRTHP